MKRILLSFQLATLGIILSLLPAAAAAEITHEVVAGESLAQIAKKYGVEVSVIRRSNKLESNLLQPGQRLRVAPKRPSRSQYRARYRVRKGDSPARIAKKHQMKLAQFRRMNPKIRKTLRPGQRVWVVRRGPRQQARSSRKLYRLEAYPGFKILNPGRAWGTFLTVQLTTEVLFQHQLKYPDAAPILVGDLSRRGGGYLAPHKSHRSGRDIDIRYPRLKADPRYVPATPKTLDIPRTWSLISSFLATKEVVYIFADYRLQRVLYRYAKDQGVPQVQLEEYFQFPRRPRSMVGIIRHEKGHRTHFHVRFRKKSRAERPSS